MSYSFQDLYNDSKTLALSLGHEFMTIDHLSAVALKVPSVKEALESFAIDTDKLSQRIETYLREVPPPQLPVSVKEAIASHQVPVSVLVTRVMYELEKQSVLEQLKNDDFTIEGFFVLFECLSFSNTALEVALKEQSMSRSEVARSLQNYVSEQRSDVDLTKSVKTEQKGGRVAQQQPSSGKKSIEDYTTNLTELAREGKLDPMIGREKELVALIETLSRRTKKNPCLTGEAGVGKTQIIDGLAQAIVDGNVPEHMKELEILSLNMGSFTAGTKYRGEFEERVDNFLKEIKKRENTIVFIDEIHTIMGAGSSSSGTMDMSNLIKPALSRGEISVIGATTYDEYRQHIEKDGALSRRFMKIDVVEPTFEETAEIVKGIKSKYEEFHGVTYAEDAVDAIMELSSKFLQNRRYPDKAIDLLDASAAKNRTKSGTNLVVTRKDIEEVVAGIANLELSVVACTESTRMLELPELLRKRVFGQEEAVQKLVDNVMVARAGLRDAASVQGAFMFVGPSGTGKTEITKALADSMGSKLIRFDMSEFSQEHTVAKLIGSPPGYVGHDTGNGLLLDQVEQHPNAVLLLDEIEKAHPKVLLTFLQVLDEGRLTGSKGKTVFFNNVTVIMTTNLGAADSEKRSMNMGSSETGQDKAIKEFLPPEFINRIDAIVKFKELSSEAIDSVIDKFMSQVSAAVASRNVTVVLNDDARAWLAKNGVQRGMGARPMKRTIEQNIRLPLAKEMLCGSLQNGGVIKFGVEDNKIVIVK
ncbi:ATP dependent Clp protease [Salmonella phage SE_PL]|nr:ClpA-like protein [Salmonella phage 7t3]QIG62779.1 ATP dependent Clp protease [Salmonella phage SE_PL]